MRIHGIEIYRDGGSIEFTVDKPSVVRRVVQLDTPLRGEPRAVRINSVQMDQSSAELRQLVKDLDRWWEKLPSETKKAIGRVKSREEPRQDSEPADVPEAKDFCRVLFVRDYIRDMYGI